MRQADEVTIFDEFEQRLANDGPDAALERLAEWLRLQGRAHELFDALLMLARGRAGLPAILTANLNDIPEPQRTQMEDAYLGACREVGYLLLDEGRVREAWMYLRPLVEREETAAALRAVANPEERYEELIDVALYEGACPELGFELVLKHYGTCNAITLFDSQMHSRPLADRQAVAGLLVRRLADELTANVRADVARREGREPEAAGLAQLIAGRPELFAGDNYHVDTTHLAAVVRFALVCDDRATLATAYELTEYGRRLSAQYQFPGHEPFADAYPAYGSFYGALLGRDVEEAVSYFRGRADELAETDSSGAAAEVLVALLARLERYAAAFEESTVRLAGGRRSLGFAPTTLELAKRARAFERLVEVGRSADDPLSFAAGLVEMAAERKSG